MNLIFIVIGCAVAVTFMCRICFLFFQTRSGVDLQLVDKILITELSSLSKVAAAQTA